MGVSPMLLLHDRSLHGCHGSRYSETCALAPTKTQVSEYRDPWHPFNTHNQSGHGNT